LLTIICLSLSNYQIFHISIMNEENKIKKYYEVTFFSVLKLLVTTAKKKKISHKNNNDSFYQNAYNLLTPIY